MSSSFSEAVRSSRRPSRAAPPPADDCLYHISHLQGHAVLINLRAVRPLPLVRRGMTLSSRILAFSRPRWPTSSWCPPHSSSASSFSRRSITSPPWSACRLAFLGLSPAAASFTGGPSRSPSWPSGFQVVPGEFLWRSLPLTCPRLDGFCATPVAATSLSGCW
jgi:hypothetical protein